MSRAGDALEARREELGLSQGEAAAAIGRSQTMWSRYVNDSKPIPVTLAKPIAAFLAAPHEEVLAMIAETHPDPDAPAPVKRRTNAERLDDLERELAALRNDVAELAHTPRRAGKRSHDGQGRAAP